MAENEFDKIAEPYRYNFEIAWEVANKGKSVCIYCVRGLASRLCAVAIGFGHGNKQDVAIAS